MRILFCGGGTAGHVTPALAIAEAILEKHPRAEIMFVGRAGGEENKMIERRAFPLKTVRINGFTRSLNLDNIKNLFSVARALKKSKTIIKEFSPDVVVGTGGYVTWPVVRAAQGLRIPTVIHEANACPGLVTKLLMPKCERVLLNLQGSEKEFRKQENIRIVGNPVREEFLSLSKSEARRRLGISNKEFLIVSFGGSGGARKMNSSAIALMRSHSANNKSVRHIHGCGNKYQAELKKEFPEFFKGMNGCIIRPYIDDMPTVLRAADAVISRCGAMTLAELSAVGAASILVPSPNVTNNHQYKNAKHISDNGAAIMIEEKDLSERALLDAVRRLENDIQYRRTLCDGIRSFYVEGAAERIRDEIFSLI